MKEQMMFGLFTALLARDSRRRQGRGNPVLGAGFIWLGVAMYGAVMIVMQGYLLEYPVFFLTNPAFFLLFFLFFPLLGMGGGLHMMVIVFSLPAFAMQMYTLVDMVISNLALGIDTPDLSHNYHYLLKAAFGSWSEQFNYYGILQEFMSSKKFSFVAFSYLIMFACVLATGVNTLVFPSFIASWFDFYTKNDFEPEYEKERWVFTQILGFFGAGLLYWLTFPYFEFFQELPFGLSYVAIWLLILTPMTGLGLCEVNRCRLPEYRVGNSIIYLYMLLIPLMCAAYYMTHMQEFHAYLNQCLQGDFSNVSRIVYPLTLCLLPYMFIYRNKQPSRNIATA